VNCDAVNVAVALKMTVNSDFPLTVNISDNTARLPATLHRAKSKDYRLELAGRQLNSSELAVRGAGGNLLTTRVAGACPAVR